MRDEETGSWWQQVTGEAILGPLKGKRLRGVLHDELTFATWKGEEPSGRVLRPDEHTATAGNYVPANWEEQMNRVPVATLTRDNALEQRTLVIGLKLNEQAKAYPLTALQKQNPVIDRLGGVPVVIVVDRDGRSVRAFETSVNGRKLEFFLKPDSVPIRLVDAETGSEWDFSGRAISGSFKGNQLRKILALSDYWFDWKTYNPDTAIYLLGQR